MSTYVRNRPRGRLARPRWPSDATPAALWDVHTSAAHGAPWHENTAIRQAVYIHTGSVWRPSGYGMAALERSETNRHKRATLALFERYALPCVCGVGRWHLTHFCKPGEPFVWEVKLEPPSSCEPCPRILSTPLRCL